jgi:outer membrane biosynthesis protein TonB
MTNKKVTILEDVAGFPPTIPIDDLLLTVADSLSWSVLVAAQNIAKMPGVTASVDFLSDGLITTIGDAVRGNIQLCDEIEGYVKKYAEKTEVSKTEVWEKPKKVSNKPKKKVVKKKVVKKPKKKLVNKAVKNFWADVKKSDKKKPVRSK